MFAGKYIELPVEDVRAMLDYCPETGVLRWKERDTAARGRNAKYAGKIAGNVHHSGYVRVRIDNVDYMAHRLAWAIYYERWPTLQIDHINRNRTDNRITNLREVTHVENNCNKDPRCDGKSKYKNVIWHSATGRWRVRFRRGGREHNFGSYTCEEEAAEVARKAKVALDGTPR